MRSLGVALLAGVLLAGSACEPQETAARRDELQQDYDALRADFEALEKRVTLLENQGAEATPAVIATPVEHVEGTTQADPVGVLRLAANPWAEVFVDGKKVGTTPLVSYKLAAGSHRLKLVNPDCSPVNRVIKIEPGRTHSEVVSLQCS